MTGQFSLSHNFHLMDSEKQKIKCYFETFLLFSFLLFWALKFHMSKIGVFLIKQI